MQATSAPYSKGVGHIQAESRSIAAEVDPMRARTERRNYDVEPIGDSRVNGQAWPALARKLHSKYCVKHVVRGWWQRVAEDWRNSPFGLEVGNRTAIDFGMQLLGWDHSALGSSA